MSSTAWVIRGYAWDLRYSARALRAIQMVTGGLEPFMAQVTAASMGTGLSFDLQALLVWSGQLSADPKLRLATVKRRLLEYGDQGRLQLVAWAAVEFCRAVYEMAAVQLAAKLPPTDDDGGDGDEP